MSASREKYLGVIPQATLAEASAWITRLHGPARSRAVEAGLQDWLKADPNNARAFESMTQIWEMAEYASVPDLIHRKHNSRRSAPGKAAWAMAFAGLCITLVLVLYRVARSPSYETGIGDQRTVNLEDGSRIFLNSETRVLLEFSNMQRRVVIKRGEAYFEVASDVTRPFVVLAGAQRVTALGTAFDVRYDPESVAVLLLSGKVAVSTHEETNHAPRDVRILEPGERLTVRLREANVDKPNTDAVTAWRRGEVLMDGMPLAEAVAEMNRHDEEGIVIDDPEAAVLQVSGIFRTGDSMGFARAAAEAYDLNIIERNGRIHLSRRVDSKRTAATN